MVKPAPKAAPIPAPNPEVASEVDADADAAALAWADEHVAELGAPASPPALAATVGSKPLLSLEEAVARVPEGVRLQLEERLRGRFREVRRLN